MKVNNIYPKHKEDRLLKKAEEIVKREYPHVKIKRFKITKDHIIVKTEYGNIFLNKSDLK